MTAEGAVLVRDRMIDDVAVLTLSGRLTVTDSPGVLKDRVGAVLARGARDIVIDLSGVRYIDSTRLGELIATHVSVSRQSGRLTLAGTPTRVLSLLKLAGLTDLFALFPSAEQAVAHLNGVRRPTA